MIQFTCVFYDIQGYEIGSIVIHSCDTEAAMEKVESMIDERLPNIPNGVDSFLLK
jgi:hypothetical protein